MAPTPRIFAPHESEMLDRALELAITSYERSQKQRPEFKEVAGKYADQLKLLQLKVKDL